MSIKFILIAIAIIGVSLCKIGIDKISQNHDWTSPVAVSGYILGLFAVITIVSGLFHKQFLFINDERTAVITLTAIIFIKVIISFVYSIFKH